MMTVKEQILEYAKNAFGTEPDAPFRTAPDYLVLRHANNRKWFALIMDVPRNKLGLKGEEKVDILNIKCDPMLSGTLRMDPGFFPAYHMNHENWLTVIMDGTVPAESIYPLLEMSFDMTRQKSGKRKQLFKEKNWIVPANPKYYDIGAAIRESRDGTIIWKQSSNVSVGDIVYIYMAAPVSVILYRCSAEEVNIPHEYADENLSMKKVMRLKVLDTYDREPVDREIMEAHGVRAVRGPRGIPDSLIKEIDMMYPSSK